MQNDTMLAPGAGDVNLLHQLQQEMERLMDDERSRQRTELRDLELSLRAEVLDLVHHHRLDLEQQQQQQVSAGAMALSAEFSDEQERQKMQLRVVEESLEEMRGQLSKTQEQQLWQHSHSETLFEYMHRDLESLREKLHQQESLSEKLEKLHQQQTHGNDDPQALQRSRPDEVQALRADLSALKNSLQAFVKECRQCAEAVARSEADAEGLEAASRRAAGLLLLPRLEALEQQQRQQGQQETQAQPARPQMPAPKEKTVAMEVANCGNGSATPMAGAIQQQQQQQQQQERQEQQQKNAAVPKWADMPVGTGQGSIARAARELSGSEQGPRIVPGHGSSLSLKSPTLRRKGSASAGPRQREHSAPHSPRRSADRGVGGISPLRRGGPPPVTTPPRGGMHTSRSEVLQAAGLLTPSLAPAGSMPKRQAMGAPPVTLSSVRGRTTPLVPLFSSRSTSCLWDTAMAGEAPLRLAVQ
jgi:hypothetical protein